MVGLYFLSVCRRYLVFVYDWVYIWRHMYTPVYGKLMVSDVEYILIALHCFIPPPPHFMFMKSAFILFYSVTDFTTIVI